MRAIKLLCLLAFATTIWATAGEVITFQTPRGGPFAIPSTEGFLTSRDLIGKHVYLFFGFTTCPDICPLTLHNMKKVAQSLSKQERENFRFLFVSIDTEVDTLERMKALKKDYGSNYIGATDNEKALRKLTSQFGAFFRVFKNKSGKRIVSHTDSIFYLNREGKWTHTLPYGTNVETLVKHLRKVESSKQIPQVMTKKVEWLGESRNCDLAKGACSVNVDGEIFELNLTPKPIRTERPFSIVFKSKSKTWLPLEVDFEGEKINMGYLRPSLKLDRHGSYSAKQVLPICELDEMKWLIRVFVQNAQKNMRFLQFSLTTQD